MQMSREEIMETLRNIVLSADSIGKSNLPDLREDLMLVRDLGFSSLDMLYMAVMIEETFQIRLQNLSELNLQTVGDVVDLIHCHPEMPKEQSP